MLFLPCLLAPVGCAQAGSNASAAALCRLFAEEPSLLRAVAVVMSFDLRIVHDVAARFQWMASEAGADSALGVALSEAARPKLMLLTLPYVYEGCCCLSVADAVKTSAAAAVAAASADTLAIPAAAGGLVDATTTATAAMQEEATIASRAAAALGMLVNGWLCRGSCGGGGSGSRRHDDGNPTDLAAGKRPPTQLDGVYMMFESAMLESQGAAVLRWLCCNQPAVGVWGSARRGDPDDVKTAEALVATGVRYVNTDLPRPQFGRGAAL